jgi:Zn-dependent peptidase ImmA (M78 family)/transcriptional regulator with XRE-family HTH domain
MSSLGEVIATARRAAGLTQGALADQVGVSQAALSRYEKDMRAPEPEILPALAKALGVTPRFLTAASAPSAAMAVDAHMRRRATAKPTVWRQLEAQLNMGRMHADQLREHVSLTATYEVPRFDPFDTTPSEAARLVRMNWRMPSGPVRNLTRWVEAAGCVIIKEDLGTSRVEGLSQWVSDNPVIMVNRAAPPDRQRLTLAHELGHLALHSFDVPPDVEEQAFGFAAEFLMPEVMIKSELRNLTLGKALSLKAEWGVSMQALIERAHSLEVLSADKRTSLYKQLSARQWRTREPGSDEIPEEHPALMEQVGAHLANQGLSPDEVAQISGYADATSNWLIPTRRLRAV